MGAARTTSHRPRSPVVRDTDDPSAADLIDAAIHVMAEKGYHGSSVRDITTAAGLAVGSLYTHFGSKHDLLLLILKRVMDDLVTATEDTLFRAGSDPADRLRAIVGVHVRSHAQYPFESLLGNTELRSLEPTALEPVISKRDAQQRMFDRVVLHGVETGAFTTATPVDAARFIVTACTAVATWYRPTGRLGVEDVVSRYQQIALDTVGYRGETT